MDRASPGGQGRSAAESAGQKHLERLGMTSPGTGKRVAGIDLTICQRRDPLRPYVLTHPAVARVLDWGGFGSLHVSPGLGHSLIGEECSTTTICPYCCRYRRELALTRCSPATTAASSADWVFARVILSGDFIAASQMVTRQVDPSLIVRSGPVRVVRPDRRRAADHRRYRRNHVR